MACGQMHLFYATVLFLAMISFPQRKQLLVIYWLTVRLLLPSKARKTDPICQLSLCDLP